MTGIEFAEKIAEMWNSGDREEAKMLFQRSQMVLPAQHKQFLKKKMKLCYDLKGIYIYKQN